MEEVGTCPPGFEWALSSCYAFASGPATATQAAQLCMGYHAALACPTTAEEVQYLSQQAINSGKDLWIGLTDMLHEGEWTWPWPCLASTSPLNATYNWCPGEPNDGGGGSRSHGTGGGGDCVRITSGASSGHCAPGTWVDYRCDQDHVEPVNREGRGDADRIGFVCELNARKFGEPDVRGIRANNDVAGAPVVWVVVLAMGLALSVSANTYYLYRRIRNGRRSRSMGAGLLMNPLRIASTSDYRAPLRTPGMMEPSFSSSVPLAEPAGSSCSSSV